MTPARSFRPAARAAAGALATAVGWSLPAAAPIAPPLAGALRIPTRARLPSAVALTFDDGPDAAGTPRVLDALARLGATATFFLVGEQVLRAPGLPAEIVSAGHAVAVHGHRHRTLLRLGPRTVARDLDRAAEAIAAHAGVVPRLHRAPYGAYSWPALHAVRARGWAPVLWSRWGRDWRAGATPASVAATVGADLRAGDVLLLHDADAYSAPGCWRATLGALPLIAEAVAARGLRFAALTAPDDLAQPPGR
jgi:peptidoglycan/xylan/chitin deacetylase (PgdA/CDA1 family)